MRKEKETEEKASKKIRERWERVKRRNKSKRRKIRERRNTNIAPFPITLSLPSLYIFLPT